MLNVSSFTDVEALIASTYAGRRVTVKPFWLEFAFGAIASTATGTVQQKVISNADFWCMSYDAADDVTGQRFLQIIDGGTNEQFFAQPVALNTVCTIGGVVKSSTFPRRVAGNSLLSASVQNGEAAAVSSIRLTLGGVLVFVYSQGQ